MKKTAMTITEAKSLVASLLEKPLKITVNKGRKKLEKFNGKLLAIFPCVFTLKIEGEYPVSTLSFSYSDLICGNIRLKEVSLR